MPTSTPRYQITANLFAIPFGLAGLAQCWTAAHDVGAVPIWPATVGWGVDAVAWLLICAVYFGRHHTAAAANRELADPTFGPFVAVAGIVPMMLGAALARAAPTVGQGVFVAALIVTVAIGGWLSGQWILSDISLRQWHPGYLLPTVAGGLIAAAIAARFGHTGLAMAFFGYGVISWMVLGTIIFTRLFTQPALALPLQSTLAIELAPPVVAGLAWFQINGGRADPVAFLLAGYAGLMALVQLRLLPLYNALPFGPAWWGFSFPYAAAVAYLIRWTAVEHSSGERQWIWLLLAVITAALAYLSVRTVTALVGRRFLAPTIPLTAATPPVGVPPAPEASELAATHQRAASV